MEKMVKRKFILFLGVLLFLTSMIFISANNYFSYMYFTVSDNVLVTNERIELKGFVFQSNYTNNGAVVTNLSGRSDVNVTLMIKNSNGTCITSYNLSTDANGTFYSRSNYYTSAILINAPSTAGTYYLRSEYINPNLNVSFSEVEIRVMNQSIDSLRISPAKSNYNPSEKVAFSIEAIRLVGDSSIFISNISINGSLRNSSKYSLQTFNCTTGSNGKCSLNLTAPSSYGSYTLEVENFKASSNFLVTPFSYNVYMKDDLGESYKNVYALGEQARVEVKINNASDNDRYTFSGYIANSAGSSLSVINSTVLNSTNSFINSFLFDINTRIFSYGAYIAYITVSKTGDGNISSSANFEIEDWSLSVNKKEVGSGFEYSYSAFPSKTLKFETLPSYRSNGSIIPNITSGSFIINLKDSLSNIIVISNATWNSTCGKSGCYEFSLTSPSNTGKYNLETTLSYNGAVQTSTIPINIISGVMSAQSSDKDGALKELFGTNEFAYLSLSAYNLTSTGFNLSDSEIFSISYMNGTEFSYTQVNNFTSVNASNSAYEWAWNSTLQRIKLDVPKIGGVYNILLFGNNRTLGTFTKIIVNPYEVCSVPKNTAGTVSSGYYYVWQFKTSDTIYFELKITQANNPLGKAPVSNSSSNLSSFGMGSACSVNTNVSQAVNNATITLLEVKSLESGALQNVNMSESTCQSSDTSGGYTCTVKPLSKWDGGPSIAKFSVQGQDGTTSVFYSRFEARAFYLYGYSSNWQNSPSDDITLNVKLYEAGTSWWSSSGSSNGISGTITLKRVEYQGRDGEYIWPPVESGYNATNVSSANIQSGTGTISLPASKNLNGLWKTGYYRAVLQATTSSGDTDYGYAYFGVKLWDVYGQPIECLSTGCTYKTYFNSKENITLYIKINKAGGYNSGDYGNQNIWGNVTISIKKIQDCRKWPCKELNSTQYSANKINVNASSPWYWNTNSTASSKYIIQLNTTTESWGTGWYSVTLDVNGTDTGSAWFNTISFYVESQPTNSSGSGYKSSIRGNNPMYFNITTTKNYKYYSSYYNGSAWVTSRYNQSDYVNATFDSLVLRTWDPVTYKQKEYNYPSDLNITPNNVSGNGLFNVTYNNGTWPTGYYYGELTLKTSDNDTSTGWLYFNVQPFRVQMNTVGNTYNMDEDQCVNTTVAIYDPDWYSYNLLAGNYSITSIYENVWTSYVGGYSYVQTIYTNYSSSSFNATTNITLCPNNGSWGGGSWGGYHYVNIIVKDNAVNDTQTGWLSFRATPFQVSWTSPSSSKSTDQNVDTPVSLTKYSSGANSTGNLTRLYQWRYDNYQSTKQEYIFSVKNASGTVKCWSNVSGQCTVNGTMNITIYAPTGGWKIGYNYIQADWTKNNDPASTVADYSGVYFEARAAYNGWFSNINSNGYYKYDFGLNENITIRLNVQTSSYGAANGITISDVEYAFSGNDCWSEYCRVYTDADWNIIGGGTVTNANGIANLNLKAPSTNWTKGNYAIRATAGGVVIIGGTVRIKDTSPPNVTISSPVNNATYNNTMTFTATTSENSKCNIYIADYNNFNIWFCTGWNSSTNSSNSSSTVAALEGACNTTKYTTYNSSKYYIETVSETSHTSHDGTNSSYCYTGSYSACYGQESYRLNSYLSTGGTTHTYTLNTANFTSQHYGMQVWCYDDDYNGVTASKAFKISHT